MCVLYTSTQTGVCTHTQIRKKTERIFMTVELPAGWN